MFGGVSAATGHRTSTAQLEDEAIRIFREVAAECERPVLLFSGGKDSVVMLHLAHGRSGRRASRSR